MLLWHAVKLNQALQPENCPDVTPAPAALLVRVLSPFPTVAALLFVEGMPIAAA